MTESNFLHHLNNWLYEALIGLVITLYSLLPSLHDIHGSYERKVTDM